jgi:hypothetical protein
MEDWKLDPMLCAELDEGFGRHSIDRFASALSTLLLEYNAGWKDPICKAVDAQYLSDSYWRKQNK